MKSILEKLITDTCSKHCQQDIKVSLQKKNHGDYSCDMVLKLIKKGFDKKALTHLISQTLETVEGVKQIEVQPPGFINIFVDPVVFYQKITQQITNPWPHAMHFKMHHGQWKNILKTYQRLKMILEHLLIEHDFDATLHFEVQEQNIYHCLDALLSDLFFSEPEAFFIKLRNFAGLIHGYLNTITLLCENQQRYRAQVQILFLSTIFLEKTFKVFELSCSESIKNDQKPVSEK